MDEDDLAFQAKQKAGLCSELDLRGVSKADLLADAKANKEMAEKAKGKGPMNAGQQGIKKSGKK